MVQIGSISWQVNGDIGQQGVSRFRFMRQDAAAITVADCNAAAAASQFIPGEASTWTPSDVTWSCNPEVEIYDMASGLVQPPLVIGVVPTAIPGAMAGNYAGGNGARINWRTMTIKGRRFIRGATYVVPLAGTAFSGNGSLSSGFVTGMTGSANTMLTHFAAAALDFVVWSRPLKGATVGGVAGIVITGTVPTRPATLRSRRE